MSVNVLLFLEFISEEDGPITSSLSPGVTDGGGDNDGDFPALVCITHGARRFM